MIYSKEILTARSWQEFQNYCTPQLYALAYKKVVQESVHHSTFAVIAIHCDDEQLDPITDFVVGDIPWRHLRKEEPIVYGCRSFNDTCRVLGRFFPQHTTIHEPPPRGVVRAFFLGFGTLSVCGLKIASTLH